MLYEINKTYKSKVAIVSVACNEVGEINQKFLEFISKHNMVWNHIRYTNVEQNKEG